MKRFVLSLAITASIIYAEPHAAQGKCCPTAFGESIIPSSAVAARTLIMVQVRCGCGAYGGQLIDNFVVNPVTGKIWEGPEETGVELRSKRLDGLTRPMLGSK